MTTMTSDSRIQLQVTMMDGSIRFYSVEPGKGWKIDATSRCLIVGKGLGRIYIPLDNVESFSPIQY
jgi:hypothetical protein